MLKKKRTSDYIDESIIKDEFAGGNNSAGKDRRAVESVLRDKNRIIAQFQVFMIAAYALGIVSPKEFFETPDAAVDSVVRHTEKIIKKIASWAEYGEIIGVRDLMADVNHNYSTRYMWMITDRHVVIITAIKSNSSKYGYSKFFKEKWNFEGGLLSDLSEFTSQHFIDAKPTTLVIDESIDMISFQGFIRPSHNYVSAVSYTEDFYCLTLSWVKKIIFPPQIRFIRENFDYAYTYAYEMLFKDREFFWDDDYKYNMDLPSNTFNDGVEITFSKTNEKPYYIRNNIIYRDSCNTEAYCLDTDTRNKRYIQAFEHGIDNLQDKWRAAGKCAYCGGAIGGILRRKCINCRRKRDYNPDDYYDYNPASADPKASSDDEFEVAIEGMIMDMAPEGIYIPEFLR